MLQRHRPRKVVVRIEARCGDLAAIKACVALPLLQPLGSDKRSACHLPTASRETPQLEEGYGRSMGGAHIAPVGLDHPLDSPGKRVRRGSELAADGGEGRGEFATLVGRERRVEGT